MMSEDGDNSSLVSQTNMLGPRAESVLNNAWTEDKSHLHEEKDDNKEQKKIIASRYFLGWLQQHSSTRCWLSL